MFRGLSILKSYIIKPKQRLMMIQRKQGWKFVFVREQHAKRWMQKGRELMALQLRHGSTRIPVWAQSVLYNKNLAPPVPQGETVQSSESIWQTPQAFEFNLADTIQAQGQADLFEAEDRVSITPEVETS